MQNDECRMQNEEKAEMQNDQCRMQNEEKIATNGTNEHE